MTGFEKHAIRHLQDVNESKIMAFLSHLKPKKHSNSHLYYLLHIKPKIIKFFGVFTFLERAPKSALFFLALLFIFSLLIANQHFLRQYWFNTVVEQYPDLTKASIEDGKLQLSPIDKVFTPITATSQAFWLILAVITLNIILGDIWQGYNVRKPQTLPMVSSRK